MYVFLTYLLSSTLHCQATIAKHAIDVAFLLTDIIRSQVTVAASALKEEKAISDDRDALLCKTMLRERDNQDR